MKIIQVYNQQRSQFGGEESVVKTIHGILEQRGHSASVWMRSSRGTEHSLTSKIKTATTGIFNPSAYHDMQRKLIDERPDLVHVHNVYPNFSPSILAACRAMGVPTVFHVHCHILTCPNWYHLRNGKTCNLCFGGHEHWCLLTNCRGSVPESAAYALRSVIARKLGLFEKNVTLFIAVSQFLRERLISAGYPADQIEVVRNSVRINAPNESFGDTTGDYVGYAGRLSLEKGVDTLIEAARICGLPVKIAGAGPEMEKLRTLAPSNVEFVGRLDSAEIDTFYRQSRFVVVPSRSNEGFCLVAVEAMMRGKPVIASRIGALQELIESGVRGLLVESDDQMALANSMRSLWDDAPLCAHLGSEGKAWAEKHCGEDVFYAGLMAVYDRAIRLSAAGRNSVATNPYIEIRQSREQPTVIER